MLTESYMSPPSSSSPSVFTDRKSALFNLAMIVCGVAAVAGSGQLDFAEIYRAVWIIVVALLANLAIVIWDEDNEQVETGSGFIPLVLAALAYGPSATLAVALASGIPFLFTNSPRALRTIATRIVAGVAIAVLFQDQGDTPYDVEGFIVAGFLCALLYQLIQLVMTSALMTIEFGGNTMGRIKQLAPHFGLALLVFGPMAVAYAYLIPQAPQAVLVATFAVVASHQLLVTIQRSRSFERMLGTMSAEIPGSLLAALDAADSYTAQHSAAVACYAFDICLSLGFELKKARQIHAAALLHDVGKIGVPDAVLTKPGRLNQDEWVMMQKHPELGANMVKRLPGFEVLEPGIRYHHERIDGSGYPDGKQGTDIPEEAQIIAVADTYSAITTARTYREARPPEFGISELRRDAQNGKLNAHLTELFIVHLEKQGLDYQTGKHTSLVMEVSRVRGWLDLFQGGFTKKSTQEQN